MSMKLGVLSLTVILAVLPCAASASVVQIGGVGAISTDGVYGSQGLLSGGETALALFDFSISGTTLSLTVTNISPAVLGTDAPLVPDAPVMSDMFFLTPSVITGMQFLTANGGPATGSGWIFTYDPNDTPSHGFGFLKKVFDGGLQGGPGTPTDPDPVIESVYDPDITDGPGNPKLASPVVFTFALSFFNNEIPSGFGGNWFTDRTILGDPEYLAAAKFMSGANGGSATVTDGVQPIPEPASVALALVGLLTAGLGALKRTWEIKVV